MTTIATQKCQATIRALPTSQPTQDVIGRTRRRLQKQARSGWQMPVLLQLIPIFVLVSLFSTSADRPRQSRFPISASSHLLTISSIKTDQSLDDDALSNRHAMQLPPHEIIAQDVAHLREIVDQLRTERPDGYVVKLASGIHAKTDTTFANGIYVADLAAPNSERPYVFTSEDPQEPSVLLGWSTGAIFNDCENVVCADLIARGCTTNGFSCGASTNVVFRRLQVEEHRPGGNTDPFKMSHGRGYRIEDCHCLDGWGPQGQGIDFVDVHQARVTNVELDGAGRGKHGIQCKQGCTDITIEHSSFTRCKHSAIQIGGTTTSWLEIDDDINFQAKDITIANCTGSESAFLVSLKSCHNVSFSDCQFSFTSSRNASLIVIAAESIDDSVAANEQILGPRDVEFRDVTWQYDSTHLHRQRSGFKIREEDDISVIDWRTIQFLDNVFEDTATEKRYPSSGYDADAHGLRTGFALPTRPVRPILK